MVVVCLMFGLVGMGTGCSETPSALARPRVERIPISPALPLDQIIAQLRPAVLIKGITVVAEPERVLTAALAPPSRNADEIVRQFAIAYDQHAALMNRLLSSGYDGLPAYHQQAVQAERGKVAAASSVATTTMPIANVWLQGPQADIDAFRRSMTASRDQ